MNNKLSLTEAEEKLADLIWRAAPLASPALVAAALAEMGWKKSTTYTVLKRLCDKGVFKNENARVSVLFTRDEWVAKQGRRFVEDAFGGSLPKFVTAFYGGKKLTRAQAEELRRLIDEHTEDGETALEFSMNMITQNFYKDPDTVDYIKEMKDSNSPSYQQIYDEYNAPRDNNFQMKAVVDADGNVELFANHSPHEVDYRPTAASDYILR